MISAIVLHMLILSCLICQVPPPETEKKKEGGIRIVDRNTGDEVKEPPAVEGVVEEFRMPEA